MIKTICVFSSSSSAVNSVYRDTAIDLGKRLGHEGLDLIFGGADVGLMSIVARTAKDHGAKVIGVIPEPLAGKGIAYQEADELIISKNLREYMELYCVSKSAENAINHIKRYIPKQLPSKWF